MAWIMVDIVDDGIVVVGVVLVDDAAFDVDMTVPLVDDDDVVAIVRQ